MTEELEQILLGLGSDEARNKAISQLVGKITIPEKLLVKAIEDYEKAGMFDSAAGVAVRAGKTDRANKLYDRAIEDYEKAGMFDSAADVAVRAGKTDRANKLRKLQELILS